MTTWRDTPRERDSVDVAARRLRVLADLLEATGRRGEALAARNIAELLRRPSRQGRQRKAA